jgi:hypothetical protein
MEQKGGIPKNYCRKNENVFIFTAIVPRDLMLSRAVFPTLKLVLHARLRECTCQLIDHSQKAHLVAGVRQTAHCDATKNAPRREDHPLVASKARDPMAGSLLFLGEL